MTIFPKRFALLCGLLLSSFAFSQHTTVTVEDANDGSDTQHKVINSAKIFTGKVTTQTQGGTAPSPVVPFNLLNACGTSASPITTFSTFGYTPCVENSEYFGAAFSFQGYAGVVHRNDMVTVQTAAGSDVQSAVTVINTATCNGTNTSGQTNDNGTTCSAELTNAVGNNSGSVVAADIVGQSGFTGNGSKLVQANQQLVNCARSPGFQGDVTHDFCALQTNNIQSGSQSITTYLGNDTSQAGTGALIGEWVASTTSAAHATLHGQVQPKYGYVNAASSIASYYSGAQPNMFLMNENNMSTYAADSPFYSLISGEKAANSGQSQVLAFDSTPAGTSATISASPNGAVMSSASLVTYTTTGAHGFTAANASGPTMVAHITGVTNTGYNIDCPIQTVPTGTTFTCFNSHILGSSFTISTISESGSTVTVTTSATCDFATGQIVTVRNVGSTPSTGALMPYDGAWTVLAPGCNGTNTFTYTDTTTGLASSSGGTVVGGWLSPSGAGTVTASNIQRWTLYSSADTNLHFSYVSPQSGNGTNVILFGIDGTETVTNILASGVLRGTHQTNTANISATGQFRLASSDTINWQNNANTAALAYGKNASDIRTWAGVPLTLNVASDFTLAANTSLQTITGLTFTLPANAALIVNFSCHLMYSQATAAVADQFGIQSATITPTNIAAKAQAYTSTSAFTAGNLPTLTTSTATAIVTFTPSAITTVWNADIDGLIENPSNASTNVINIMAQTSNSSDLVTVKRGSFCRVF